MIISVKRNHIIQFMSAILFLGLSLGAMQFAAHPMIDKWEEEKILVRRVNTSLPLVALTFDDGPVAETTSAVLDALQRNQAHGTFFMLGQRAENQPELVKRITREGHEVGSHSYSHANYNRLKTTAQMEDIIRSNQIIERISGQPVRLFRPPGGYLSVAMVEKCRAADLTIAYWTYTQDPKDWRNGTRAAAIAHSIIDHLEPGQIIILHDGAPNARETAKALDILIPELNKLGYSCVTVSDLMAMENK
ncbi:MAG: polysaccharide deacetylase family protein [Syntrophomonas sp.]